MTPVFLTLPHIGLIRGLAQGAPERWNGQQEIHGLSPERLAVNERLCVTFAEGPVSMTAICRVGHVLTARVWHFTAEVVAWEAEEPLPGVTRMGMGH